MSKFRDMGTRQDLVMIDPAAIQVEKDHNPRDFKLPENRQHLDNLKTSIRAQGVLQPLWVRWDADKVILVDGESRLRATVELIAEGVEIKAVPCKLVKAADVVERKLLALTANSGKPLSKWEAGAAYRQLEGWGWSHAAIAMRTAVTERYVREAIELSLAPTEVKTMMSTGQVTERAALKTVREHGSAAVEILNVKLEEVKAEGKTVVKAERNTKEADFIKTINAIYNDCKNEFEAIQKQTPEEKETYCAVRVTLLEKLFALL